MNPVICRTKALNQMVGEAVAEFFVRSEMVKHAKRCECDKPIPGEFDHFEWTTCRTCGCLLGRADLFRRTA